MAHQETYAQVVKSIKNLKSNEEPSTFDKSENTSQNHLPQRGIDTDGFIGVDRRRKRTKKFFISGIHESVKESQILSYLEQRNITPTHISLFRSQRRGTRSAKIHIPSLMGPLVQTESFWPKFVKCRLWQPKTVRNSTVRGTRTQFNTTYPFWGILNIRIMAQIPVRISSFRDSMSRPKQSGRNRNNLISVLQRTHADVSTLVNNIIKTSINNIQPSKSCQKSKIRIAHLNIRSLKKRDHLLQLRCLVKENCYDVFAVSESWLNSTVSNAEVEIEGYKLSRLDRTTKSGGGVCVYTRTSLKVNILTELTEISPSGFHQLWMQIQYRNLKSILLCTVYRPLDCSMTCFEDEFLEKHTLALTHGKEVIMIGALNCDILKNSPESRVFRNLCSSLNLTQLITNPTRVTSQSSTLIDVIMTTNTALVAESGVMENHISDHYLIFTVLKLKLPKPQPTFITVRSYKQYDRNTFLEDIAQEQWEHISLVDDVDEQLNQFNSNFLRILDRHAPFKTIKVRYRQSPFVDNEIKELMKKRDRLHRVARQIYQIYLRPKIETKNICDWDSFRVARNEVKETLREAEKRYVQNEIYKNKEPNAMWKVIRRCVPRKEISQPVYTRDMKELAD